tara:strand:+ start:8854 stop:9753 length:900 start_codon:yes stop_codon:yes gene_type:complete
MRSLLIAILVAGTGLSLTSQDAVFRSNTQTVPVFATVIDADRRLVPSLDKNAFTILDNGKPQEITFFLNEIQPFTAVIMLDTSLSMTANIGRLRAAAEQFLIRMLPEDKGQVGAFNDKIQFSGEFTSDRDELIGALEELQFGNPTKLYDAIAESMDRLKNVDSRKVVLVFTDGDDTASKTSMNNILNRAKLEEVMVYAIGLEVEYFNGVQQVRSRPDRNLQKLSQETGGGYFELQKTDDLGPTFRRVVQELHSQYTLGFTASVLDNKEHEIEVLINKAGLTARARKSYIASLKTLTSTP